VQATLEAVDGSRSAVSLSTQ